MFIFVLFSLLLLLVNSSSSEWILSNLMNSKTNAATKKGEDKKIIPKYDYFSPLSNHIQRFFDEFDPINLTGLSQFIIHLPMDITETLTTINVLIDIPGVNKNDITIAIHKNNELVITAHKEGLVREEGKTFKKMERFNGNITRTLNLPEYAELEKMEATYNDGVLCIKIPKAHLEGSVEECPKIVNIK